MVVIRSLLPIVAQQLLRSRDFILLYQKQLQRVLLYHYMLVVVSQAGRQSIITL